MERRTYVRIPFTGRGRAEIQPFAEVGAVYFSNISRQGLSFYSTASIRLGSEAIIEFDRSPSSDGAAESVRLHGRILWREEWDTLNSYGARLTVPLDPVRNRSLLEWISAASPTAKSESPGKIEVPNGRALLTKREIEITRLIGKGAGNREIARRLSISVKTVETHRANIYSKLKVHNAVQLLLATEGADSSPRERSKAPSPASESVD